MVKICPSPKVGGIQTGYQALRSKALKTKKMMVVGALIALAGLSKILGAPSLLPTPLAFDAVLGGVFIVAAGGTKLKLITHTSDKEYGQKLANYLEYNEEAGDIVTRTYANLEESRQKYMPIGPLFPQELEHEKNNIQSDSRLGVDIREKVPYRRVDHTVRNEQFIMLARIENGKKTIEFFRDAESREKRITELYRRPMQQKIRGLPNGILKGSNVFYTPLIDGAQGRIRQLLTSQDFVIEYHGAIADLYPVRANAPHYLTREQISQDRVAYEQTAMDLNGPKTRFQRLSKRNGMFPLASIDAKGHAYLQFFESQTARQRFIADCYTER